MPSGGQIPRREGESEDAFRARQKRAEIRSHLENVPGTLEEFAAHPLWKSSKKPGNLTFRSGDFTIAARKYGGFGYVIGGGVATHSRDTYPSAEAALAGLWEFLEDFRANDAEGDEDSAEGETGST